LKNDRNAPVVVFVWYRDTARLLADDLMSESTDQQCENDDDSQVTGGDIRCGVITGDIIKQSVRNVLADLSFPCICRTNLSLNFILMLNVLGSSRDRGLFSARGA
jgi:hypothetical protein